MRRPQMTRPRCLTGDTTFAREPIGLDLGVPSGHNGSPLPRARQAFSLPAGEREPGLRCGMSSIWVTVNNHPRAVARPYPICSTITTATPPQTPRPPGECFPLSPISTKTFRQGLETMNPPLPFELKISSTSSRCPLHSHPHQPSLPHAHSQRANGISRFGLLSHRQRHQGPTDQGRPYPLIYYGNGTSEGMQQKSK